MNPIIIGCIIAASIYTGSAAASIFIKMSMLWSTVCIAVILSGTVAMAAHSESHIPLAYASAFLASNIVVCMLESIKRFKQMLKEKGE